MKVTIEGVHQMMDGEYTLEMPLRNSEWRTLKKVAGVYPQTLEQALRNTDMDVPIAFAMIALKRAGKPAIEEIMLEAEAGRITLDLSDEAEEENEAPKAAPLASSSGDESSSSGTPSKNGSDTYPETVTPTSFGAPI